MFQIQQYIVCAADYVSHNIGTRMENTHAVKIFPFWQRNLTFQNASAGIPVRGTICYSRMTAVQVLFSPLAFDWSLEWTVCWPENLVRGVSQKQ